MASHYAGAKNANPVAGYPESGQELHHQPAPYPLVFHALAISARCSINRDNIALLYESRDFDGNAGFQCRVFGDGTASITLDGVFAVRHQKWHVFGQLNI